MVDPSLNAADRALIHEARRGVLTTIDERDGRPRSVPFCFALVDGVLYSPLDEKPKAGDDPATLRRARNLRADPRATILIDRWSEDWTRLAYVELEARGDLVGPDDPTHAAAVAALRARYPQYAVQRLEDRPMLRFRIVAVIRWADVRPEPLGA